jgi:hypothetical protein
MELANLGKMALNLFLKVVTSLNLDRLQHAPSDIVIERDTITNNPFSIDVYTSDEKTPFLPETEHFQIPKTHHSQTWLENYQQHLHNLSKAQDASPEKHRKRETQGIDPSRVFCLFQESEAHEWLLRSSPGAASGSA